MWIKNQSKKTQAIFFLTLLTGLGLRLFISWQPIDVIISKNLPDDAYYYFVLARNASHLGSISLDGINSTNGFHPLWLILLLPIFGLNMPLGDLQVHWALTLSSLIDLVTMGIISQVVYHFTKREDVSILSTWIYAANPMVIFQTTNGLETSLLMALLAALIWRAILWLSAPFDWKNTVMIGIIGGLTFLARSDSIFFLGFFLVAALFYWGIRTGLKRALIAGSISGLMVIPWLTWSRAATGAWMQVSGIAVPYAIMKRIEIIGTGSVLNQAFNQSIQQIFYPVFWLRGDPTGLPLIIGILLWIIVLGLLVRGRVLAGSNNLRVIVVSLLLASLALIVAHAGVRWYPRPWYFIPTAATFAITLGLGIAHAVNSQRMIFLIVALFSAYFAISGYIFWQFGFYPWQKDMLAANLWLEKNVPQEERIGSFNAGIYAYYSGRTVINLDGVVNNHAFEAIKNADLLSYMQESEIRYLIDYDHAIRNEYGPFLGGDRSKSLQEIAILGGSKASNLGMLRVYSVTEP